MNIASIQPSTVDGIRQLAKKIRRERSIPHTKALDDASRQAGFENFVHAKRKLSGAEGTRLFPVYLSIHWFAPRVNKSEPRPSGPRSGREILRLDLVRSLPSIVAKHRLGRGRGLYGFRMEYEDHVEHRTNVEGQAEARKRLLAAARSLRFMEATGLQPVSTRKYDEISLLMTSLPGNDHLSDWFDPETGSYVCLDEPYVDSIRRRSAEREHWLERNGLVMLAPKWEGIYVPGKCSPCLISRDQLLLERLAGAMANIEPVAEPEVWPHETGRCNDDFVSPGRQADAKPRRRRPGPSWSDRNGATPYGGAPGIPSRWRPTKAMPFHLHKKLGPLMQRLSWGFSPRVQRKLEAARSDLENWSISEHKDQHDDVYDIYYGGPHSFFDGTNQERLDALTAARTVVCQGYDDCKPRRELLAVLDAAINDLGRV